MGVTVSAFRPLTFATTFIYSARVTPLNSGTDSFTGNPNLSSRLRDSGEPGRAPAAGWPYRHGVTETANARKIAFATFVRRALDEARATRAWSGTEVSRRTGVSRQTINRWVRGDWASDPEAERVVAFCEGLGLNPAAAFAALGWDRTAAGPRAGQPPLRWTPTWRRCCAAWSIRRCRTRRSSTSGKPSDISHTAQRCRSMSEKGAIRQASSSDSERTPGQVHSFASGAGTGTLASLFVLLGLVIGGGTGQGRTQPCGTEGGVCP